MVLPAGTHVELDQEGPKGLFFNTHTQVMCVEFSNTSESFLYFQERINIQNFLNLSFAFIIIMITIIIYYYHVCTYS